MADLVIKGGEIITPEGEIRADIAVYGEKIAEIGSGLKAEKTFDATGMLIIPGGVDAHVHLEMPTATSRTSDDWSSGTYAAAHGGTTTVVDFVEPQPDQTLLEALDQRIKEAEGRAWVDYALHMTLMKADDATLAQIPAVMESGVTSFKVYTTFPGFGLDDPGLLRVFEAVAQAGGMVMVHAENDAIIQHRTRKLINENTLTPQYFPHSHPPEAEVEAIQRVIQFAKITGVRLYIVHISTAEGAAAVGKARSQGYAVFGETCPQYLLLDESRYFQQDQFNALGYVCNPPLRTERDQQSLWDHLAASDIQTVCTDHCAFNMHGQKDQGLHSFVDIPPGLPGIEARLGLIYTFGVRTGRLTPAQWVSCCSNAAAHIFGIYPQKGHLGIGADADLVVFDPDKEVILHKSNPAQPGYLNEAVDYTPYEGVEVHGWPVATFLRGQLVAKEQTWVSSNPAGKFLSA